MFTMKLVMFLASISLSKAQLGLTDNNWTVVTFDVPANNFFTYGETDGKRLGPTEWDKVHCADVNTCPGWPTKWDELNPEMLYTDAENNCVHCTNTTDPPPCRRSKQSPIHLERSLTETEECIDRHRMNYRAGTCRFGQLRFEIMPHTLRIHQPKERCNEMPNIDYSRGFPDPWHLAFTDISVPSHHVLDGTRYHAEIVLSHVYSVNNRTDRLVGNVAVLLEKGTESDRYDFLDLYIKRFEEEAAMTYRLCKRKLNKSGAKSSKRANVDGRSLATLPRHERQVLQTDYFNREFNPYDWYLKTGTEYYWRYEGTTLVPPCLQTTHWRVLKDPIKVAPSQILDLERLIAQSRDPRTCKFDSVGRRRNPLDGDVRVDVNRPLQPLSPGHKAVFCECIDWKSRTESDTAWCQLSPEERGVVVHPTSSPTTIPTSSSMPSASSAPSSSPSISNTPTLTVVPSENPSVSGAPTLEPSSVPTISLTPSMLPSELPSNSNSPTGKITVAPSMLPWVSEKPTDFATLPLLESQAPSYVPGESSALGSASPLLLESSAPNIQTDQTPRMNTDALASAIPSDSPSFTPNQGPKMM